MWSRKRGALIGYPTPSDGARRPISGDAVALIDGRCHSGRWSPR